MQKLLLLLIIPLLSFGQCDLEIGASVINVSCDDKYSGFINLNVCGGTAPYTYIWSNGEIVVSSISALSIGTYEVSVADNNGCISSQTFVICDSCQSDDCEESYEVTPDCLEEAYCSQLSVTDVVVDNTNMTIDIAIYDGNVGGAPYPYIAYTIDNLGDTIQTGNINSFGNLGLDTSWYEYSLNSLPNYPLTVYYVYGMNSDTCVLTYNPIPIAIEEYTTNKKLLHIIDILGRDTNSKGFNIEIYDDGSVEKKYVIE